MFLPAARWFPPSVKWLSGPFKANAESLMVDAGENLLSLWRRTRFKAELTSLLMRRDARCNGTNHRYFDLRQFKFFYTSQKVPITMFSRMPRSLLTPGNRPQENFVMSSSPAPDLRRASFCAKTERFLHSTTVKLALMTKLRNDGYPNF